MMKYLCIHSKKLQIILFIILNLFIICRSNAMEIQYGNKKKEIIRFTEVPFKKKKFTHVEYLKGYNLLKEYVLNAEMSNTYQKDIIHLMQKNSKMNNLNDSQCKDKIHYKMDDKKQATCFDAWSLQDKKRFKSWLALVQGDFKSNKKKRQL